MTPQTTPDTSGTQNFPEESVTKLRLTQTAQSLRGFALWHSEGDLDMDAPYQRGHVWGRNRQVRLIYSLLLGVPVPSVIINDRRAAEFHHPEWDDTRNSAYAVVDGKQRLTAIIAFLNSELPVPAQWFDAANVTRSTAGLVVFSDLHLDYCRHFQSMPLGMVEGCLPTLEAEEMVFGLLNSAGLPQGASDPDSPAALASGIPLTHK